MQRTNAVLLLGCSIASSSNPGYWSARAADAARRLSFALDCVAETLMVVGRPEFYTVLASALCPLFGCNRYLIMSYSRSSKPAFLFNRSISSAMAQLYLESMYEHDPIYQTVQNGLVGGVLTLHTRRQQSRLASYRRALSEHAQISDELVLMLPTVDKNSVALCFNQEAGCFDKSVVKLAKAIYPTLREANRLHNGQSPSDELQHGQSIHSPVGGMRLGRRDFLDHLELLCSSRYLSTRERELLTLTLEGLANRCIADRLRLALGTVKNYKRRLYKKLGVSSEREMVKMVANFPPAGHAV